MVEPEPLFVSLTGRVALRRGAKVVGEREFGGQRARVALALLVLERQRPVTREELAEALWPGELPATWATAVRVAVSRLRTALGPVMSDRRDALAGSFGAYQLRVDGRVDVDVERAEAAVTAAEADAGACRWETTAASAADARVVLVRPFLGGVEGPWVDGVRNRLRELLSRTLEALAQARTGLGQYTLAAAAALEAVSVDPWRESAHRRLMEAHEAGGNRAEALRAYERCRRLLAEELGVAPSVETTEIYQRLLGEEPERPARPATLPGQLPLVGRDQSMTALRELVTAAASGRGGMAVLTGEAGIGKTRLTQELSGWARGGGSAVLWGTCRQPEWSPPFAPFAQMVTELAGLAAGPRGPTSPVARRIERILQRLRPVSIEESRPTTPEERFVVLEDLRQLLLAASVRSPVLVVLEDLHWADVGTLDVLGHLAPSLGNARLAVIATCRTGELDMGHPVMRALAAIGQDPGAVRIELAGLDEGEVSTLLAELLPDAVVSPRRLVTETGGNPFFLEVVLLHLLEDHDTRLPREVHEVVGWRLARLSNNAHALLATAALFEGPFPLDVTSAVAALDEGPALDALDEALAALLLTPADLADGYQFRHDLVRHVLSETLSPSRRLRAHRHVAEALLLRHGEDLSPALCREVAGQYYRSVGLAGAERGVPFALRAAADAEAAGAFDTTTTFLTMAIGLLDSADSRRRELRARLGMSEALAGHHVAAAGHIMEVAEEIAITDGPEKAASVLADGAWTIDQAGGTEAAWPLVAKGVVLAGDDRRDDVWARLCILNVRRQEAEDTTSLPVPIDNPDRQAAARILDADPRFRQDAPWAVYATRQQILDEASDEPWPLTIWAGCYRPARTLWEQRADSFERAGRLVACVGAWVGMARCDVALGDFGRAGELLDQSEDLAGRLGLSGPIRINLVGGRDELCLSLDQGWDELLAALGPAMGPNPDPTVRSLLGTVNAAVARIAALGDDTDTALTFLEEAIPPLIAVVPWAVTANRMACDAATALWVLGRTDHLETVQEAVREKVLIPDFRSPMMDPRVSLGRLAALDGRTDEATQWFARARGVLDADGARPLRAVVDLDEAVMLHRGGRPADQVRPFLDEAIRRLEQLGMIGWLRRAERLLLDLE